MNMIEPLRHAEQMTRHRDQSMVDSALVDSLIDLLGRTRKQVSVTIYRVEKDAHLLHIAQTAWSDGRESDFQERLCQFADLPPEVARTIADETAHFDSASGRGKPHHCWFPVFSADKPLACIEISLSRALGAGQLKMINGMLGLYRNYLSLLEYSQHDSLTGLLNRKTFDDNLDKLLLRTRHAESKSPGERRADASDTGSWLAILDIDYFKKINDRYGHLFGDEVLILLTRLMKKVFRRHDKLFRFGGEEFVVIAQNTTEANALKLFNRLRATVEAHEFPQIGQFTVSIGFTRVEAGDNATLVLGRADEALYYGKQHGRNQVHLYETLLGNGQVPRAHTNSEADIF